MRTHMSTSVRGMLRHSDNFLRGALGYTKKDDGTRYRNVKELRQALEYELAMGRELLPDDRCDNFDPVKGCLGHAETQEARDGHHD